MKAGIRHLSLFSVVAIFCMASNLFAQSSVTLQLLPLDDTWTLDHKSYSESETGMFYVDTVQGIPVRAMTGWKKQLSPKVVVYKWVTTRCSSGEKISETDDYRKDIGNSEEETIVVSCSDSTQVCKASWKRDMTWEAQHRIAQNLSQHYGDGEGKEYICGTEFRRRLRMGHAEPQQKELTQVEAIQMTEEWKRGQ